MAHKEQKEFFQRLQLSHSLHFNQAVRVLEVGSQDINGTVRGFFPQAREYLGLDLGLSKGVDWVIPGELVELPTGWADIALSTECFEHCKNWDQVLLNMIRIAKPHGLIIITCAGIGRATHGTIDTDEYSSPFTTDYYKNLSANDIASKIPLELYFSSHGFEVNSSSKDLYFWGIRSDSAVNEAELYWDDPMSRLARVQGQLGQAAARHSALQLELDQVKTEAEQSKLEAAVAKVEAEQAKVEVQRLQSQLLELNLGFKSLRSEYNQIIQSTSWRATSIPRQIMDRMRESSRPTPLQTNHRGDERLSQRQVLGSSLSSQPVANTLNKPLPISRKVLRWGYQKLPLPIATKRQIWTRLMLLKGRLRGTPGIQLPDSDSIPTLTTEEQLAIIRSLSFPQAAEKVVVSIIIPCYNQIHYTLSCLASILKHPPSVDYEVIIINDASPGDDYHLLDQVAGLVVVHNQQNAGYLESCNTGMKIARGEYICLLNNDVNVLPASFDALLRTFKRMPSAGLVGSKLIYPTGQLQEAGGIVWNDGSAWNVGRLRDINEPQFNYLRSVDYCSAASIMVPKRVLETLGGFDPKYKPAYYEDTDLAFRIRSLGLDVFYQPESVIIHYEGISHGKAVSEGLKKHQLINAETFYSTWQAQLKRHRPNGKDPDQEKDRGFGLRVLLIDKCTPSPDRDAGSVVLLNLMLILRHLGYQPTFIPDDNYANLIPYTPLCQSLGIECLYHPYVTSVKQHLDQFGSRYDLVILFRPDLSQCHLPLVRRLCPQAKVIYYPHDLHYIRMLREAALNGEQSLKNLALESKKIELDLSQRVDSTIVVSITEKEELNKQIPDAHVDYLPLIVNELTNHSVARFGGGDLVFIGNFNHSPNEDAVCWFAETVLPLVNKARPDVIFHVIGANPPASVCRLAGTNMVIHGFVEDLDSLLSNMTLSVAPLRFGAGMKGKVVSAMRAGLPVVCTTIGCEGMQLEDRHHTYIADDAASFAESVLEILSSQAIWERLSQAGINLCAERWGKEVSINSMSQILTGLGLETAAQHGPESLRLYPFD